MHLCNMCLEAKYFRKQLGGKLGSSLQSDLGVNTVGDLLQFSEEKLQECYGINTGYFLSLNRLLMFNLLLLSTNFLLILCDGNFFPDIS